MNYIYYNEFGKEVKKYLSPIAKGSSGIKIYIFSDFDNSSETEYEVSASFKKADGFVAGDIFLPLSSNTKINPYNQQAMYYRELTIGNDVTDIVGGLQLSIRYIQTNVIEVDPETTPPVTYEEKVINVTGMVTFNIYDATSFISPPQNTALINLKNYLLNYIDTQDANIFAVDRTFLQSLGVTNNLTVGNTLEVGDIATFNQDVTVGVDLTVYGRIFAEGGLDSRANKIINVAPPENPLDAVNKSYVDTILITKENLINKITEWGEDPTNTQYPSAKLVKDYLDANIYTKPEIDAKLSATYKPKGTITGTELLAITPTSDNEGFVYNISTEFTTTIDFIEGAGITHRAGENVVIVEITEGVYKFDVLSGFVDLGSYALKTDILALGTTSNDAYRGDLGQIAYNHSQSAHAPSNAQKNSDITKAEIEEKLIGEITTHSHALPNQILLSKIATGSTYTDILIGTPDGSIGTLSQSTFAPATHNHTKSQITDFPTIPTVTNDLTNALKSNYDAAYTHSQTTHAPSNAEQNVQSDWNQTINTEDDFIKNKPTIPSKTSDLTNDSGFATETYVNNKVSAVYKPQGSLAFNDLVVGLLIEANNGFVYNITDAFTTNEYFVEGAGKNHSAGTNVVIVYNSSSYKFDVLGGTVDLTPYELQSNKVSSWSEIPDNTKYTSEKLVKDSLDAINVGLENIGSLSPLRFAGYFTGGTVSNDFNNLIRPFENLTEALPDFYINNIKGAMFVCNAASDFVFNTVYTWVDGVKTTPITFNWAAPYDEGLGTVNFEVGDTISILNFAYDTVENEMFILIKVEKSSGVKADKVIPASTGNIPKLNASGNLEDSGFKLEKSVPANAVFTDTPVPQASTNTRGGIRADTKQATDTVEVKIDVASEKLYAPTYPTIPDNKSYSKTIAVADWTTNEYAVTITNLTTSDTVLLSGADEIFTTNGLSATITANTLTFEVTTTPTESIVVNFTVIKTTGGSV